MSERWRQNPRCPANVLEGEAAVVSEREGKLHTLDVVGTSIWELLEGDGLTIDELVAELVERYEGEESVIREDTVAFLAEAEVAGIVLRG